MVQIFDGNSEIGAYVEMLFDLLKAFDQIVGSHKSDLFILSMMIAQHLL